MIDAHQPRAWTLPLRKWQQISYDQYLSDDPLNFLLVATPGAGKTLWALRIAYGLLEAKKIGRILIIVPTKHLCTQWCNKASECGLDLTPNWENSSTGFPSDFLGAAITYQQLAMEVGADRVRWLTAQEPTLVIIDEIHHAGENRSWGDKLKYALEASYRRLALSGTPFRGDNNRIPFVEYKDGKSQPNYEYGYGDALRDGVCRTVFFPTFEGEMEWFSRSGEVKRATFEDELIEPQRRERLNTAINPRGNWLAGEFRVADEKLREVRDSSQADAKGLIVCRDIDHARDVATLVASITREEPAFAASDEPGASEIIRRFERGRQRWLVAVKMVSEGVDIPNLRVGVYATNIISELYFRQFVGRFVRMQPDIEDQSSFIYIPRDPDLIAFATAIKEERDHYLLDEEPKPPEAEGGDGDDDGPRQPSLFMPIRSEAIEHNTLDVDGKQYTPKSIDLAEEAIRELNLPLLPETVARIGAFYSKREGNSNEQVSSPITRSTDPKHARVVKLKEDCNALAKVYAPLAHSGATKIDYRIAHILWMHHEWKPGVWGVSQKTGNPEEEELEAKKRWLTEEINKMKRLRGG